MEAACTGERGNNPARHRIRRGIARRRVMWASVPKSLRSRVRVEAGASHSGWGPVMPSALPRRRLLDLHPQARGGMDEVAGAPVTRAKLPVGLERHGHDLLHQLPARGVADDGGPVEAVG